MSKTGNALLASLFLLADWSGAAWAHGPVERAPETSEAKARLFVADAANGDLVALDLPSGELVARLSTPPYIMSLALSRDGQHLYAMRGRSTDRDFVTVVHTGTEPTSGGFRPPYVARTILAKTAGPGDHNRMLTVHGKDALIMEGSAEFLVMDSDAFTGFAQIGVRTYRLGAPDHYFYVEAGEHLYIGHLRKGYVQVINGESGAEVARIEGCPVLHGKAKDEATGRLFYACRRDIMVLGTRGAEMHRVVARVPYPAKQRVGAFLQGAERIFWAYTEGIRPMIYRLDAGIFPYALEVVTWEPSIRQWATAGGKYLLSLTRGGVLQIRDGASGNLLRSAQLSKPFTQDYHEHVDKAILPDIKSMHGEAYVSLPHEGRIAVVELKTAEVKRYFATGGEPTRLVLVEGQSGA